MKHIKGRVWVFGDSVDTDQILPGYAMVEAFDKLGNFAMAGSPLADFPRLVQKGDIIVAGKDFGCGSSREQAPVALKSAGVALVIASSFARIFRRNAINIGLPVLVADLAQEVQMGEYISANLESGVVECNSKVYQGAPVSLNTLATLRAGGLINRVKEELGVKGR